MGEVTGTRERQHRRSERFPKLEPFPKLIERFDPTGSATGSVVIPWPSSRCRGGPMEPRSLLALTDAAR